ncbi:MULTISPECIES: short-chain dehydrogenase/reductase [Streptomyces]|uniref:short-chain dehydrogenase/reductase n=1 Tax=Streptomyces TaxID=1883 RepID=UPI00163C56E6|nr:MULTISPECIES: short-chain dehydrogenase/reductase [Streptomyces]MBC2878014.1 SDR family NAD(P)-dependent oxidoreductase [Streptomyces sp. TYQ1024]UBI39970.1 SDR family NAD(P)-dependent oxidoreductase [Streptomyces mobaraensis]UKW32550.1 short-chain dehydrogenase/reductase [Streptomyces sp. TYQ1024]
MARYSLTGRTVLVTGATGGIGTAGARAPHARGANVVLLGRDTSALSALAREPGAERALPLRADVTDPAAIDEAVARAEHRFGELDVVFANAGAAPTRPTTPATIDPETFERVIEVNVLGTWRTVRAALPHVVARRGHVLVNASVYAYVNGAANAPYAASKAAVEQLVRALRVELGTRGTTAGVLYPGWVETRMSRVAFGGDPLATRMREAAFPRPFARAVGPELVAARVVRGIERRAAAVTVPGRWRPVGALRGLVNPLVDRALIRHGHLQSLLRTLEEGGGGPMRQAEAMMTAGEEA